ncbi:uncharacterized protein LOC132550823 [Ylistrum balloti]|uniref:uncharacterized protein LOC132550823 n=1 Tax=Ylistrum balloti TaxID=509963 RepID=UPI002905A29D|nr:uncharacterized protein LOC132550823 [Ylistrum balloti]
MTACLSCVQLVSTRKSPSATELDLLWSKYGDVRSQLAVLESERSAERDKIENIQRRLIALEEAVTDMEGEIIQITDDLKSIAASNTAQDDGTNATEPANWEPFPFALRRGSIQMNASYIVLAVDIETSRPFSYLWFENRVPILDDDLLTRVEFSGGNIHTLELRGNQSSTIRNGQKVISLLVKNHDIAIALLFNAAKHSFLRVYDYTVSYRGGQVHSQFNVTSGSFELRSEMLRNKDISLSLGFMGLNGNQTSYKAITAGSWLDLDGKLASRGGILNVTNGSLLGDTYRFTYDLLEMDHGGLLSCFINVKRLDDVFKSVEFQIYDSDILRHGGATLPEGSLVYLKDFFPTEFKLGVGDSSVIQCVAMGNPPPRMAILKLHRDGHESITGYASVVLNRKYVTSVILVIKPTEPEVANISFVCAATSNGVERRLSLPTRIVIPPKFLKYEVLRGPDENVVVKLFVKRSDPPKPAVSCRENDDWGDFIWGKSPMYTANETSTDTGYTVTFNVNMAATSTPPTKFVCQVMSVNGVDRIIVPIHL